MERDQLDIHIVDYFWSMFSANPIKGSMEFLLAVSRRITNDMNMEVAYDFIVEEINVALKQMHPTKVSRSDAMPSIFYQRHWHIVGPSITKALLQALNSS